jgi:hypothetical protein
MVRILPPISERLIRAHSLRPLSAKTHENPARRIACRNTYEFPVPVTAAIIGRFSACPGKRLSFGGGGL